MLPSQLFLLLMASQFASQILCFSNCDAVTEHLKDSQKVFIDDLISALETFSKKRKWSRAIISGAAFLYWMFGISKSDDVRHTVLGILRNRRILRNRNSKDINVADDIIVRRVQSAIVAMIETFGDQGKPLNVQKDTEITTSLLASWANNKPTPINSEPEIYQAAQLCVIYKPKDLIASWQDQNRARKCCVHMLVRIAEEVFDDSMEINDEILQEYLAKIRDDEDHVMLKNTKKSKGKLAGVGESQIIPNDSDANSAVNVVSYPFPITSLLSSLSVRFHPLVAHTNSDHDHVSVIVTLMFCLGDLESALKTNTGQPYIAVVLNATHSVPAATVLVVVIFILVTSCAINLVTTSSRQLW